MTFRSMLLGPLLTPLFAVTLGVSARADTINLGPVADTTLYAEDGTESNGAGNTFFAGVTAIGEVRRGLIRFDLSAIPAGSTIDGVTLRLYCSRTRSPDQPVALHRLTESWGEASSHAPGGEGGGTAAALGDATWTHRVYDNRLWATSGGTFAPAATASTVVGNSGIFYTWTSAGMIADVQLWLDTPGANFGWIVIGNEELNQTTKRFESRQSTSPSQRPLLTITYTPPVPPTGACCPAGGGCLITTQPDCVAGSGTYQGDGTGCTPDPCAPPQGACCFPNTACLEMPEVDCGTHEGTYQGDATACAETACPLMLTPFVDPLPIPPIAQPTSGLPGGTAHYQIAMTEFEQTLHRDLPPTRVWGYAGSFPGPTIEARRGSMVTVEWINDLRDEFGDLRTTHYLPVDTCLHGPNMTGEVPVTVVHLHGGHVPADSDGHPEATFPPGQSSPIYTYPNNQPAATLWYHDHALGITRLNVYMGLAGLYLVRDDAEEALDLPRGEYEVPLAIQDRSLDAAGTLMYHDMWHEHFFGDFILVNGKVWPYLTVKQGKYRFRMLNGSNSRVYTLGLSDGASFWQIGTDTGLLPAPVPLTELTLSPGERADVIVDFAAYAAGTQIVLANSAAAPFPGSPGEGVVPEVMQFVVSSEPGHVDPIPAALVPVPALLESSAARSRDFMLHKMFDPECGHDMWMLGDGMWWDVSDYPRLGRTEIWSWINRSGVTHPMHMHLVSVQVLDRQDFTLSGGEIVPVGPRVPPPANEAGWKDTVQANPDQITRVIAHFDGYTGAFAYHCHILEHEDHAMMRQFRSARLGDWNLDDEVDATDYWWFTDCLSGPGTMPAPPSPATPESCQDAFDFDADQDVDLADISAFQAIFASPGP